MHGELPKTQVKVKPRSRFRRGLTILIVLAAVVAALVYVFYGMNAPQQRTGGRAARFAGSGPAPVLATAAVSADVPVYLNAVGTTKALNTVTVRSQVLICRASWSRPSSPCRSASRALSCFRRGSRVASIAAVRSSTRASRFAAWLRSELSELEVPTRTIAPGGQSGTLSSTRSRM